METGIELIAQERAEQIEKHGRTVEKDAELNSDYQLLDAAVRLLSKHAEGRNTLDKNDMEAPDDGMDYLFKAMIPDGWNEQIWNKMFDRPYKNRLVIAGALIAAEIDRLNSLS